MKWRVSIAICTFACVSFSASAPISFQDDFGAMYPIEYYPAYFQNDFAKIDLDIAKWFRSAANSVKHFYSYVNALIFGGSVEKEQAVGRYPTFQEKNNASDRPHTVNNIHPQAPGINLPHIQAVEIYKDSNGNMVMRKLTKHNGNLQFSQNVSKKSDVKANKSVSFLVNENAMFRQMNSKIAMNPFHWNEKLEKDELFSGAFQSYAANPELLWHSGIFPFQPMGVFNAQGQNLRSQGQSTEPPSAKISEERENTEISEQNEPSTSQQPEVSTTVVAEEKQPEETSSQPDETSSQPDETAQPDETSDSSNDETPSDNELNSHQYEISMDIERIKNNNSDSDTNNDTEADPDTTESSDDTPVSDEIDERSSDNDDADNADLTELDTLDTMQVSSGSDQLNEVDQEAEPELSGPSMQEIDSDVNKSEDDDENSSAGETSSTPQETEATEKVEISEKTSEPVTENVTTVNFSQESGELDIAKRVMAIVNPQ